MAFQSHRNPSPNTARSYAHELPAPAEWSDPTAKRVFDDLTRSPCLVDMYLVEAMPRPLCEAWPATPRRHKHGPDCPICAGLVRAYGDTPHVIAYRLWDEPGPTENAEDYLIRHIAFAKQRMGALPY